MVTFDKGGRVIRLEDGAHLDARQVGILFAQTAAPDRPGRRVVLTGWDRDRAPAATRRIDEMLHSKGPEHKQTLLLALSMGVLTRFAIDDEATGERYHLEGTRSDGYTVREITPLAE